MKRFHVHVHVENLDQSLAFYSKLFAAEPTRVEADYAKWMLDDPRINFAISTRGGSPGIDHLGIQTDDPAELATMKARAEAADMACSTKARPPAATPQREALGHRPARHRLGALPHAGRHPRLQRGQKAAGAGEAKACRLLHARAARQADRHRRSSRRSSAAAELP